MRATLLNEMLENKLTFHSYEQKRNLKTVWPLRRRTDLNYSFSVNSGLKRTAKLIRRDSFGETHSGKFILKFIS